MSSSEISSPETANHRGMLVKAVVASTIGTAIEWYDFFLYSTVTPLVFAKLFFPNSDPLVGTLQAFLIYFVGFLARPVGAFIFGHYGDRAGRKAALISTLLLMGIATLLVAFVPGYNMIGIWGAIILTVLRFLQGVGVGGEWGGSVLLAMEWTKSFGNRGFVASWPQFGVPVGLFLANLAVLGFSAFLPQDQFLSWGWRVPFVLSAALVLVGLWIRLGILETPTFARLLEQNKIEKTPALEVVRRQPKPVFLSPFVRLAENAPFYLFTAFVFTYGTQLKISRDLMLNAVMIFAVIEFFTIPLAGFVSDRIGRKRTYLIGTVVVFIVGFLFIALMSTKDPALVVLGIVLGAIPHSLMYGPQAALIAEQFTPRMRYSGASIGYQLASIIAGGPAPLIATWLFATYKTGTAISWYIALCAVISFIATLFMTEYSRREIHDEYEQVGGATKA
jgi:metabolite-proton symporter